MENKNIENPYVGATCKKGNKVILEKTPAGYCLSTWDEEGPRCQISNYASTEVGAKALVPDRVCEENLFCNGGCGCGIVIASVSEDDAQTGEMVYYVVEEKLVKLVAIPKPVVEAATANLPYPWTADEVVPQLLEDKYLAEEIVLTPEDLVEVNYFKLEPGVHSEYSYLFDKNVDVQVIEEL